MLNRDPPTKQVEFNLSTQIESNNSVCGLSLLEND